MPGKMSIPLTGQLVLQLAYILLFVALIADFVERENRLSRLRRLWLRQIQLENGLGRDEDRMSSVGKSSKGVHSLVK